MILLHSLNYMQKVAKCFPWNHSPPVILGINFWNGGIRYELGFVSFKSMKSKNFECLPRVEICNKNGA
jgi:hypothetical protein